MKLILFLFLFLALSFPVYAQTANDGPKTDKPGAAKPDPLTLLPAEMEQGSKADGALKEAVNALNAALLASDNLKTDSDAAALGWKTAMLFQRVKATQAAFSEWVESVRSAHGCKDCLITDGKLVRPPAPEKK
jgi:hypothetical protein